MVVDNQIGVFAHIDSAYAFVDAQLHRRINGHHLQGFFTRESAVANALGGFLVQVRGFFCVIGIDGDHHAASGHDRRVIRDGIVGFHFVRPPIRKRGSACSGRGDFVGHFVTFENVLESSHFKTEFLGHTEQHQNFVFTVAVRVHVAFPFQYFDQRIQTQVTARRNEIFFSAGSSLVVVIPFAFVIARFGEGGANGFFHAHARRGIALFLAADTEVGTLGIFAESKLDARHCAFERQSRGWGAPAQLDHHGLSADGVRGTVQDVSNGHSAGEITINIDVIGIQDIRNIHHG